MELLPEITFRIPALLLPPLLLLLLALGLLLGLVIVAARNHGGAGAMDDQDIASLIVKVGALVLIGLPEYLRVAAEWRLVAFGLLLVAVTLFAPRGLAGMIADGCKRLAGTKARGDRP